MAVARSSSGGVSMRYVIPVLWMTSYLHIMGQMEAYRYSCSEWRHCVVVCSASAASCWLRRVLDDASEPLGLFYLRIFTNIYLIISFYLDM